MLLLIICAVYMGALERLEPEATGWRKLWKGVGLVMLIYGSMLAICGSLGLLLGGRLCDWLVKRGHRDAPLRIAILAAVLTLPSNLGYLVDDKNLAFFVDDNAAGTFGYLHRAPKQITL